MFSFQKTYTLPFKYNIPNYKNDYLAQTSVFKRYLKFFKRCFYMFIKRQQNLEIFQILPKHQNILWINISAPSLGDSLMDLSSRTLLLGKKIDLFTDVKNAHIYKDDSVFNSVLTDVNLVTKSYDLVIIDSYSSRSIKIKSTVAPNTDFIGMYGHYNGPEVNRVLFSFHQMNHLLGYIKSGDEINSMAKNSIFIADKDQQKIDNINLPKKFVAIVLGGEWDYRTYNYWNQVIEKIFSLDTETNFVFIGSDNARDIAKELIKQFTNCNIVNCVGQYSFNQTAQIISKAQMLLCCDGGLMHAANALNTPIIPLFARLTPAMQLTDAILSFPLFDEENVNNIAVEKVFEKYKQALNYVDSHPQGE